QDLLMIELELVPFGPFAERVWELRSHVTSYDAWSIAVAEELDLPLATLDRPLAAAPGPRCRFLLPSAALSLESGATARSATRHNVSKSISFSSGTGFSACRRRRPPVRGERPFPARCGSAWRQPRIPYAPRPVGRPGTESRPSPPARAHSRGGPRRRRSRPPA